jgi:hypothetical protein
MDLKDVILQKFEGLKSQVLDYFDEREMEASGEFRRELRIEQEIIGNRIVTRLVGAHYSEQLSEGRRPGTPPPKQVIYDWIESKPSAQATFEWASLKEYEKKGIAYVIARKIGEEGTTYYREGGTDLLLSTTEEALELLFNDIIDIYTNFVINSFITDYRRTWQNG